VQPQQPHRQCFRIREKITALINNFPGIVVVDEAYVDFSWQESILSRINLSKTSWCCKPSPKPGDLAGIRLGMAFAPEEIIALFNKVKPPYNVNELTQRAAIEALSDQKKQAEWVRNILWQRTLLTQYFSGLEYVERIYPSDANFLLVKVRDANALYRYLADRGIVVRNRSSVPGCEGCLRITVGTPQENERLLEALVGFS
jgi:histidinol-phosphate aminotransferase